MTGYEFNSLNTRMALLDFLERYPRFQNAPISPTELNNHRRWLEAKFTRDEAARQYWSSTGNVRDFAEFINHVFAIPPAPKAQTLKQLPKPSLNLFLEPSQGDVDGGDGGDSDGGDDHNDDDDDDDWQPPRDVNDDEGMSKSEMVLTPEQKKYLDQARQAKWSSFGL